MNRPLITSITGTTLLLAGLTASAERNSDTATVAGTDTTVATSVTSPTTDTVDSTTTTVVIQTEQVPPSSTSTTIDPSTTTSTTVEPVRGMQFPLTVAVTPIPVVAGTTATISIDCDRPAPADNPGYVVIIDTQINEIFLHQLAVGPTTHRVTWQVPGDLTPGDYTVVARCFFVDHEPPLDVPVDNRFVPITVVTRPAGPIDSIPQTQ